MAVVTADLVDRRVNEVRTVAPSSTVLRVISSPAALYTEEDDGALGMEGMAISGLMLASLAARRAFRPPLPAREWKDLTVVVVAAVRAVLRVDAVTREREEPAASLAFVVLVALVATDPEDWTCFDVLAPAKFPPLKPDPDIRRPLYEVSLLWSETVG